MPFDSEPFDGDTSSMTTMLSIAIREDDQPGPSRWHQLGRWCKQIIVTCTESPNDRNQAAIMTEKDADRPEFTTSRTRWRKWIWKRVSGWKEKRLMTVCDQSPVADSASDSESERGVARQLRKHVEADIDFDILTASSMCGIPITPTQLLMTQWEMEEILQAVEEDDSADSPPKRTVAQAPQLNTLSEIDENSIDEENFNFPSIGFQHRDLSIVYEEEEGYDGDDDDSDHSEPWDEDTSYKTCHSNGFESMYSNSDYDDEVPPKLAHVLQQMSPSKQPWIRKRCSSPAPSAFKLADPRHAACHPAQTCIDSCFHDS